MTTTRRGKQFGHVIHRLRQFFAGSMTSTPEADHPSGKLDWQSWTTIRTWFPSPSAAVRVPVTRKPAHLASRASQPRAPGRIPPGRRSPLRSETTPAGARPARGRGGAPRRTKFRRSADVPRPGARAPRSPGRPSPYPRVHARCLRSGEGAGQRPVFVNGFVNETWRDGLRRGRPSGPAPWPFVQLRRATEDAARRGRAR